MVNSKQRPSYNFSDYIVISAHMYTCVRVHETVRVSLLNRYDNVVTAVHITQTIPSNAPMIQACTIELTRAHAFEYVPI